MTQVPKTAAGFNMDFKALKKDLDMQISYLKRIPINSYYKSYFAKTELETGIFSEILRTLAEKVSGAEDSQWACTLMLALSKTFKFDMLLMFVEDQETAHINKIVEKIRQVDPAKADKVA